MSVKKFTLIEMLIVIAIIGILAGLIVSRYCFLLDDPYPY